MISHVLSEDQDYQELGGHYFDEWDRQGVKTRLVRRLEKLGYEVKLEPVSPAT
jgi:transposase